MRGDPARRRAGVRPRRYTARMSPFRRGVPAPLRALAPTSALVAGLVLGTGLPAVAAFAAPASLAAQAARPGEVRQLVTFRFLPGRSAEATRVFAEQAVPLYERNAAMRSFRGLREVESPVPLDLVVISSFDGMAGMDASNEALRALAVSAGSSIGAIYGGIAALSQGHTDEFVSMLPELGGGDPVAERLVALVRYRAVPGAEARLEGALREVAAWERARGVPASTGRFLVSDGWTHLRVLGFPSLGAYQAYVDAVRERGYLTGVVALRREVILAPVPELAVR